MSASPRRRAAASPVTASARSSSLNLRLPRGPWRTSSSGTSGSGETIRIPSSSRPAAMPRSAASSPKVRSRARILRPSQSGRTSKSLGLRRPPQSTASTTPASRNTSAMRPSWPTLTHADARSAGSVSPWCATATTARPARSAASANSRGRRPDPAMRPMGAAVHERQPADPGELVDGGETAEDHVVLDVDVARERDGVGENASVRDLRVVRDVAVRHQQAAVADAGHPAAAGRADVHRRELADLIRVADHQPRCLSRVFEVLRNRADGGELEDDVAFADGGVALDHGVRTYPGTGADLHLG